jgi:hypothetical protein
VELKLLVSFTKGNLFTSWGFWRRNLLRGGSFWIWCCPSWSVSALHKSWGMSTVHVDHLFCSKQLRIPWQSRIRKLTCNVIFSPIHVTVLSETWRIVSFRSSILV